MKHRKQKEQDMSTSEQDDPLMEDTTQEVAPNPDLPSEPLQEPEQEQHPDAVKEPGETQLPPPPSQQSQPQAQQQPQQPAQEAVLPVATAAEVPQTQIEETSSVEPLPDAVATGGGYKQGQKQEATKGPAKEAPLSTEGGLVPTKPLSEVQNGFATRNLQVDAETTPDGLLKISPHPGAIPALTARDIEKVVNNLGGVTSVGRNDWSNYVLVGNAPNNAIYRYCFDIYGRHIPHYD